MSLRLVISILEKRNLGYNRYKETPTPKVVGVLTE